MLCFDTLNHKILQCYSSVDCSGTQFTAALTAVEATLDYFQNRTEEAKTAGLGRVLPRALAMVRTACTYSRFMDAGITAC